jgi:hypothetical protein
MTGTVFRGCGRAAGGADEERRHRLLERLTLARAMMGSLNPLDFIENWLAPEERYRPKYVQAVSISNIADAEQEEQRRF